jgi:hypothetical protein
LQDESHGEIKISSWGLVVASYWRSSDLSNTDIAVTWQSSVRRCLLYPSRSQRWHPLDL